MMKTFLTSILVLFLLVSETFASIKQELILAIERQGTEVVISKLSGDNLNQDFSTYVVKVEALKALSDLSQTNAFVLENPNRFVIDIPSDKSFKDESIFLADDSLALLRFGKHADKKRIVIDFEDSNIFSLDKNINSRNSISYKFKLTSQALVGARKVTDKEVYTFNNETTELDIPTAKELESYLTPQSALYIEKIKAQKNNIEAKPLDVKEVLKKDYSELENKITKLNTSKSLSYNYFYALVGFLLISIFLHRSSANNKKNKYRDAIKNLKQYSPEVSRLAKNMTQNHAHLNSLGSMGTTASKAKNKSKVKSMKTAKRKDFSSNANQG